MRYITRKLYDEMQTDSDVADAAWEAASAAYGLQFQSIEQQLPASARVAAERSLHDAVFQSIEVEPDDVLEFVLEGSNCPWPEGEIRVRLAGVVESEIPKQIVGNVWLYEEWSVPELGQFELAVLTEQAELRVVAREIEVTIGEYPVLIADEHRCASDSPDCRFRIVQITSPGVCTPTWLHTDSWEAGVAEADDSLVRNLGNPNMFGIRYCPYCGLPLG